jgi:hypothetical protein
MRPSASSRYRRRFARQRLATLASSLLLAFVA